MVFEQKPQGFYIQSSWNWGKDSQNSIYAPGNAIHHPGVLTVFTWVCTVIIKLPLHVQDRIWDALSSFQPATHRKCTHRDVHVFARAHTHMGGGGLETRGFTSLLTSRWTQDNFRLGSKASLISNFRVKDREVSLPINTSPRSYRKRHSYSYTHIRVCMFVCVCVVCV